MRERLETDLRRLAADVPGVSVALLRGSQLLEVTSGVVNTRTGVAVTPDTLFPVQSITKVFTATLVLQLVDDGLVQLDEPVQTHLPEFHTADEAASARITVRHLLTHTGGFEGDLWQPTTAGPDALDRFVRDLVAQAPQHSEPGQRFSYCNAGFGTLGRLVEVLRDSTFEQALRRHLAEPLGIDELAFSADQALAFRTAIGHVPPAPSAPLRPTQHWALMPPSNPAAGNQLALSARDLLKLGRLFLDGGCAPDGTRVLSAESVELMLRPQLPHRSASSFQGLGWRLPRPGVVEHGGGAPGIASLLTLVPDAGLAAVVLTNADAGAGLSQQLVQPLVEDLAGVAPAPPLPTPEAGGFDAAPFLGRYATRQSLVEVTADERGLWLTSESRHEALVMADLAGTGPAVQRQELRRLDGDTFVVLGDDGRATRTVQFLERDPDGRACFLATDRVAPREDPG